MRLSRQVGCLVLLASTRRTLSSLRDLVRLACFAFYVGSHCCAQRFELLAANGGGWGRSIEMLDASGRRFACLARDEEPPEMKPSEAKTVGDLLGSLEGLCARLNQGWWTYEWCHRQDVRQYHQEHSNGPRNPDWSLGAYARSEGEEAAPAALGEAVDIFDAGGQRCDETQRGRASRVTFSCCEDGRGHKPTRKAQRPVASPRAFLTSVVETPMCEYSIAVCAPSLCAAQARNTTAARLLRNLEDSCLQRHEGWWSFEFCYRKHARQFHVQVDESNNRKKSKVVQEFSLGKATPNHTLVVVDDQDDPRVELEYENGTACDVHDSPTPYRATTVRLKCGDTSEFASMVEDRTCHYVFTILTPALCKHPDFVVKPTARSVLCNALDDDVQEAANSVEVFDGSP